MAGVLGQRDGENRAICLSRTISLFPKGFPTIDIFVTILPSRVIVFILEARDPKHHCSQKYLLPVEEWANPTPRGWQSLQRA